ncbi:SDR family NAD(P)-dependent oxidoreductase [Pseudonocardia sp. GCM10023141]|uniref:SDR family NAD(P)-dependent oxidoreductase n=1 Tax=Pseudonocardia sp. GCM10023141 TaxID=3252653 RepID=UPI00360D7C64
MLQDLQGSVAVVTGGAGGLGEATVRALVAAGATVGILDLDAERGKALAHELGDQVAFYRTDVTSEEDVTAALTAAAELGPLRYAVVCHGAGGGGTRTVKSDGTPHDLAAYKRTIDIYLTGTFNVLRLAGAAITKTEPNAEGERGAIVLTASIAGYEGTIGQIAYASAKGGVIGMTIVAARDLAISGIRVATIAPGTFLTPAYPQPPEQLEAAWGPRVPFPQRMGRTTEFADLALSILGNPYINGEVIRIDGALRFQPRYSSNRA